MTRSITVVNTSNWDGEDYDLSIRSKGSDDEWRPVRLKPGDTFQFGPDYQEFKFEAVESKKPAPFYSAGRQVFPTVVSFVGAEGEAQPHPPYSSGE